MATIDMDAKRASIIKWAKLGMIAVGAAITAPLAFTALEGLVAWGVFLAVGFVLWTFAPVFATYVANKRIQALVLVVEANPIETMQNLYKDKNEELATAADHIRDFEESLGNFRDHVKEVAKDYPDDVADYQETQQRMEGLLASMKEEQTAATGELADFAKKIRKAQMLYELAKDANKMLEKSGKAQDAVFAQIKEQVAFDTVRSSLNRAFANLNAAVDRRKNAAVFAPPKALTPAIDVSPIASKILDKSDTKVLKSR